jgi:cytochrome c peroxidase
LATLLAALACSPFGSGPIEPPALNPDLVQRGALLFMSPQVAGDGSRSCATCHPGGGSNGLFYTGGVEVPPMSVGARRVLPLRGMWQTPPYLWDGSAATPADAIGRMLEVEMRGARLEPEDLAALEAYVLSIPPFDNGRIQPDGVPVEPVTLSARRGSEVFVKAECKVCHPPPTYAHRFRFDIGTGGKWSVPTLRGVSQAGRLGHDGRWGTLEEAMTAILEHRQVELTNAEFHQLKAYLELL